MNYLKKWKQLEQDNKLHCSANEEGWTHWGCELEALVQDQRVEDEVLKEIGRMTWIETREKNNWDELCLEKRIEVIKDKIHHRDMLISMFNFKDKSQDALQKIINIKTQMMQIGVESLLNECNPKEQWSSLSILYSFYHKMEEDYLNLNSIIGTVVSHSVFRNIQFYNGMIGAKILRNEIKRKLMNDPWSETCQMVSKKMLKDWGDLKTEWDCVKEMNEMKESLNRNGTKDGLKKHKRI